MKVSVLTLCFSLVFMLGTAVAQVTVYEGTLIKVENTMLLDSGKEKAGNTVEFILSEPITSGDKVVIPKGARVVGTITEASPSKMAGRKGKLNFSIDYLYLPESGKPVKLRAQQGGDGKSRSNAVIAAALVVNPLFLAVKGKNIVVQPGTPFDVYIDETFEL